MESNREEAVRAKEIAEKKLKENDVEGAREFARKAQNLFPGLEGLAQFLATIAVYVSAQNKIAGEVDWYRVLGVDPLDDGATIRKHFRKMALTLHPDRNKSFGSEGAFKVLSEAWSVLSDKCKRQAYDQKRGMQQNVMSENQSTPARKNDNLHTFPNNSNISARDQKTSVSNSDIGARDRKTSTNPQSNSVAHRPSKTETFWTGCNNCRMKYEYLKIYLNQKLRCPKCRKSFVAVEIPELPTNSQHTSIPRATWHQQKKVNSETTNSPTSDPPMKPASALNVGSAVVGSSNKVNVGHGPFSKSGDIGSGSASVISSAHVVQPACATLKRGYEGEQTAATREEALRKNIYSSMKSGIGLASNAVSNSSKGDVTEKKRRIDEQNRKLLVNHMATGSGMYYQESINICQKNTSKAEIDGISGSIKANSTRNLSKAEIRNMLMGKARTEIHKKLNEWSTATKDLNEGGKGMKKEKLKTAAYDVENSTVNGLEKYGNMNETRLNTKPEKHLLLVASLDSQANAADFMSMSVPDSDFHDFDKDRIEKSFGENQVWAAYDDSDGMPRFYALIHSVSKRPFKMRISWLNSRSNNELGPMNWIGSGFYKTSGDFWVGKHEVNNKLNSFSHRVIKWTKGKRGVIQIFPRKGDVWALYRNWSSDWNEYTTLEVIQKYDVVEVLEDYNEEKGVTIVPLVKVSGFKSVFHQQTGEVRTIPKQEIFRFSHQVLSYLLAGQEAANAPKGCLELDPAALPLELLQVITEANDQKMEENAEKVVKQDELEGIQKAKGE